MGLTLDNYLSIGGLQSLRDIRRALTKDVAPSAAKFSSSHEQVYISAKGTNLDRSSRSLISRALGQSASIESNSASSILPTPGKIPYQAQPKTDPRTSPFVNIDELDRKNRTQGIGDRASNRTNTRATETPKLFLLSEGSPADPYEVVDVDSQPQDESQRLRGAILQISKQFLLTNPNPELSELETEIDSHLGSGTSELFHIQLEDLGNGKSAVDVAQIEYNDLGYTDRETFDTAIASVNQSFGEIDQTRTLEGADIDQHLNELQSLLGLEGAVIVSDLGRALSQTTDVQKTLEDFYVKATDLGLSESDQESLKNIVDDLKTADANVTSSFDFNSLVDDFKAEFTSNRYGPAYSPSTIAANAALTANTIFLAK